jgi:hypothetical protein
MPQIVSPSVPSGPATITDIGNSTAPPEERVARQLDRLTPMRLQAEGAPNAPDGGVTERKFFGQCPRAPMGRVPRCFLQRVRNHLVHLCGLSSQGRHSYLMSCGRPVRCLGQSVTPPGSLVSWRFVTVILGLRRGKVILTGSRTLGASRRSRPVQKDAGSRPALSAAVRYSVGSQP